MKFCPIWGKTFKFHFADEKWSVAGYSLCSNKNRNLDGKRSWRGSGGGQDKYSGLEPGGKKIQKGIMSRGMFSVNFSGGS